MGRGAMMAAMAMVAAEEAGVESVASDWYSIHRSCTETGQTGAHKYMLVRPRSRTFLNCTRRRTRLRAVMATAAAEEAEVESVASDWYSIHRSCTETGQTGAHK